MSEELNMILKTINTFNKGLKVEKTEVISLCFNKKEAHLLETYINDLQQENQLLKEKLNQYEDPEDMTLMFMWCGEKAKDKIKELQQENQRLQEREKLVTEHYVNMTKHASNLEGKIIELQSVINEVKEIVEKSLFRTDIVDLCRMKNQIKDILEKVGDK